MHQLLALLLLFWFLEGDDHVEQLVSQAHQGDSEVYDHRLSHHLWCVFGIGQLRGEV